MVSAFRPRGFPQSTQMMSKCIDMNNILRKEEAAAISRKWCLLGLKPYWGLPLCETLAALRHFDASTHWHTRAVFGRHYLVCQG